MEDFSLPWLPQGPVVPDLPMSQIEDMVVVDNVSEHMLGNVYCKWPRETNIYSIYNIQKYKLYH